MFFDFFKGIREIPCTQLWGIFCFYGGFCFFFLVMSKNIYNFAVVIKS